MERHILKALKSHLLTMESGGEYLKMLYRSIKLMTDDKDEIVQYHANSALADLDQFMRGQLFFTKEQLRGDNMTSIRILR